MATLIDIDGGVGHICTLYPVSCFMLQQYGLEFSHTEFTLSLTNGRDLTPGTAHQLVLDEQGSMVWISPQYSIVSPECRDEGTWQHASWRKLGPWKGIQFSGS